MVLKTEAEGVPFWKALIIKNVFLILPLSLPYSNLHLVLPILASIINQNESESPHALAILRCPHFLLVSTPVIVISTLQRSGFHSDLPPTPGQKPHQAMQQRVANSSVSVSSFAHSETAGLLWKNPENLRVRKLGLPSQLSPLWVVQCWARR